MRGDFVEYRRAKEFGSRLNWRIDVTDSGALPHFERADESAHTRRHSLMASRA